MEVTRSERRIVILSEQPVQHFCPQYRSIAAMTGVDLTVVFGSLKGYEPFVDPDFEREVSWGGSLLEGFAWVIQSDDAHVGATLTELQPDLLIIYGYRSRLARQGIAWSLRNQVVLAYISDTEDRHKQAWAKRAAKMAAMRMVFSRIDFFLSVGNANEEFYRSCGVDKSRILRMHFPIDPSLLAARRDPIDMQSLRDSSGVAPGSLVVLNVGKLISRKRQVDLIDAVASVPPGNLHLVLAGSGPDEDQLRAKAETCSNVTFAGFVEPSNLAPWYELADVYAHPSTYDPHPLAVSEAAAFGCALLVSDVVGSWGATDDVRPFITGLVHPAADVDSLRAALILLAKHRKLTSSLGHEAREVSIRQQAIAHGSFMVELLDRAARHAG